MEIFSKTAANLLAKLRSQSGKNASFSAVGALLNPLIQLAAMPVLFQGLGAELFGVWILVNSVLVVSGIASFGVGEAATKFIAIYRARHDPHNVEQVIRVAATVFAGLAAGVSLVFFLSAPLLATALFKVPADLLLPAIQAFQIAACGMAIRFFYANIEACLRGFERYDIDAVWSAVNAVGTTAAAVVLVSNGFGLAQILAANVLILLLTTSRLTFALRSVLGSWRFLLPSFHVRTLHELGKFAIFTWIQSINGILFQQADRLIVGAYLGAGAAGIYSVCMQLVQTSHAIFARGSAFVFPMAAKLHGEGSNVALWQIFKHGMAVLTVAGSSVAVFLAIFAEDLLALWMGPAFAAEGTVILAILAAWSAFNVTSILPFYVLNAAGSERINTFFGTFAVVLFVGSAIPLVSALGAVGAAWSRVIATGSGVGSRCVLFARLFPASRWTSGLLTIVPVVAALAPAAALIFLGGDSENDLIVRLGTFFSSFGTCLLATWLVYWKWIPSPVRVPAAANE